MTRHNSPHPDYRETLIDVTMTIRYDGTVPRQVLGAFIKRELAGNGGNLRHPDDRFFHGVEVRNLKFTNRRPLW